MANKENWVDFEGLMEHLDFNSIIELRVAIRTGRVVVKRRRTAEGYLYNLDSLATVSTFSEFMLKRGVSLRGWQVQAANEFLNVVKNEQLASGGNRAEGKTLLVEGLLAYINEHGNEIVL